MRLPHARLPRRVSAALIGSLLAAASLALAALAGRGGSSETLGGLSSLAVIAGVISASSLIASAARISPAVVEVFLGLAAGYAGVKATEGLELLAMMGSTAILFLAGAEVDLSLIRSNAAASFSLGLSALLAPFLTGFLVFHIIGYPLRASLLASLAVSTTGVAIVYAILKDSGLYKRPVGQSLLSSAMIVDALSVVGLTILIVGDLGELLAYFAALLVLPLIVPLLIRAVRGAPYEAETRLIIAILVGATLLAESLGMHAALYAFALGLSVGRSLTRSAVRSVESIVSGFMAPVFFAVVGVEAASINLSGSLILAVLILGTAYVAKVAASYSIIKRLADRATSIRLSLVMSARMTVSTVIAFTGMKAGIIPGDLAGAVILSAAATVIAAALAARS